MSLALNIITVILILVTLDALWMLFVLYRAFVRALQIFVNGNVHLPWRSKWSILCTALDVYEELLFEDPVETLFYMPLYSIMEPDLGVELFSGPFLGMMRDGLIEFDIGRLDRED